MEIRRFEIKDLNEIFELLNQLYTDKLQYERFKEIYKLKLNDSYSYYIVAVENDKIVGVLLAELQVKLHREKKQCFIEDLVVDKEHRNRGIGKSLLQNAIAYARDNECDVVELTTYLDNVKAIRFYESNNFIKNSYKFKKYL